MGSHRVLSYSRGLPAQSYSSKQVSLLRDTGAKSFAQALPTRAVVILGSIHHSRNRRQQFGTEATLVDATVGASLDGAWK